MDKLLGSDTLHMSSVRWKRWFFIAVIAVPATTILHEFSHFITAKLLGSPNVALHYASVSFSVSNGEANPSEWQLGTWAASGPLLNVCILLGCFWAAYRQGPKPMYIAPAFMVVIRIFWHGLGYLFFRIFNGMNPAGDNFDELKMALYFDMNPDIFVVLNLLVYFLVWVCMVRLMTGRQIWKKLVLTALGTVLGIAAYMLAGSFIFYWK
jgi:hypothetical protein